MADRILRRIWEKLPNSVIIVDLKSQWVFDQFGFKSTIKSLSFYLRSQGVDWDSVWRRVEEVCVKTVLLGHREMKEAGRGLR